MRFTINLTGKVADYVAHAPNKSRRIATILHRYRSLLATLSPQDKFTPQEQSRLLATLTAWQPGTDRIIGNLTTEFRERRSGTADDSKLTAKLDDLDPIEQIALIEWIEQHNQQQLNRST
jgi:hypothetical protein